MIEGGGEETKVDTSSGKKKIFKTKPCFTFDFFFRQMFFELFGFKRVCWNIYLCQK